MKKTIRSLSDRLLKGVDLFTAPEEKRERIEALVRMMRPFDCGRPLVRIGDVNDGGYLLPDDFDGIEYCFSAGVGNRVTFELDCLQRNIKSFLADASVEKPPQDLPGCSFVKKYLGARNTKKTMTLERWLDQSVGPDFDGDLILQMDIEGSEFETLLAASDDTLSRFRIVVVEFHRAHRLDRRSHYRPWFSCLQRLTRLFDVVHVHPNNSVEIVEVHGFPVPKLVELTFLRKDRTLVRRPVTTLPNPLDAPNRSDRPDVVLPKEWLSC